mmetsp:Transcript_79569/g.157619  ORF Transcript_79569/g.157619 Transcript_79569/m.157619 type:complete len:209 (+) Transcript_79569:461-1087(+)
MRKQLHKVQEPGAARLDRGIVALQKHSLPALLWRTTRLILHRATSIACARRDLILCEWGCIGDVPQRHVFAKSEWQLWTIPWVMEKDLCVVSGRSKAGCVPIQLQFRTHCCVLVPSRCFRWPENRWVFRASWQRVVEHVENWCQRLIPKSQVPMVIRTCLRSVTHAYQLVSDRSCKDSFTTRHEEKDRCRLRVSPRPTVNAIHIAPKR